MKTLKPYECIESTVEVELGVFQVRVWRDEDAVQINYGNNNDIIEVITGCSKWTEMMRELAKLPRVSAVQVREKFVVMKDGRSQVYWKGNVIYTVPFNET